MSNDLVTQNEVTQAMSQLLMDVASGRRVEKSKIEKQIEVSDALCRRMQTRINMMKVYIEAKKHGVDFTNALREIRAADLEAMQDTKIDDVA